MSNPNMPGLHRLAPIRWRDALVTRTALSMALRITLVVIAVTALSYWHIVRLLSSQTEDKLRQYASERAAKETSYLSLAEEYQSVFRKLFLEAWPKMGEQDLLDYQRMYQSLPDGTTRLRREAFYGLANVSGTEHRNVTGFIGRGVNVADPDLQKRLLLMWRLVDRFGPAWTTRFTNLYAFGPENLLIGHWDGLPWGLGADPALDMTKESWSVIVDPANNPQGKTAWTDLYYDKTADLWMVTTATPIVSNGRMLGAVALDVVVNDLFQRVSRDKLDGTTNLILSAAGGLVVDPAKLDVMKAKVGQVRLDALGDARLSAIYQAIAQQPPAAGQSILIDHKASDALLAVANIAGPNWWFITVYPKSLLKSAASETARFILALSLLGLVLELLMLYFVLRKRVVEPLQTFVDASEVVAGGDYGAVASGQLALPEARKDEVGVLARTFRDMSKSIVDFRSNLEAKVEQRTRELALAIDEARNANEAKSKFLAHMSHEIRTPMNAVIGMSKLALNNETNRKQRDYLEKIHGSAKNLLGVINDILDYSKIEAKGMQLEQTPFDLVDVSKSVGGVVALAAQSKGLEILFDIAQDVPRRLIGDPLRLAQVLTNLVSNAVKFTAKGEVIVSVRKLAADSLANNGATLHFAVKDSGIGIPSDRIAALFLPFTQVDSSVTRKYGGTGLGLTISRELVQMMGGDIRVDSELNKGSTFSFDAHFGVQAQGTAGAERNRLRGQRALVVDDNAAARMVLSEMLRQFGMDVDVADSGIDALALLQKTRASGLSYRLMLVDWNMPGMDGLQTARTARAQLASDPGSSVLEPVPLTILMVTAFDYDGLVSDAQSAGIAQVLTKPLNESSLYDAVLECVFGEFNRTSMRDQSSDLSLEDRERLAGLSVLVVDDSALNRQIAIEFLAEIDIDAKTANDGREAINVLQSLSDLNASVELVLMDIQMPELDGMSATREIRQQARFADLPIIAMTAHTMTGDREQAINAGMNDHLSKPIEPEQLYKTLLKNIPANRIGRRPIERIAQTQQQARQQLTQQQDDVLTPNEAQFALLHSAGFEIKGALQRHLNKPTLLNKILGNFADEYTGAAERLAQWRSEGKREEILRLVHTLKSSAAGIGVGHLSDIAKQREAECLAGQIPSAEALTALQMALNPTLFAIQQHLSQLRRDSKPTTMQAGIEVSKLLPIIEGLEKALREDDAAAADWIDRIGMVASGNSHLQASLQSIRVAIQELEYPRAMELLIDAKRAMQL
jgi:two-component system, sensor histidine kinase and response regulator